MADTYRAWLRGAEKWQNIAVIDLRSLDGIGKLLQSAGLKTLGEIDEMEGPALLKLPGLGVGVGEARTRHNPQLQGRGAAAQVSDDIAARAAAAGGAVA